MNKLMIVIVILSLTLGFLYYYLLRSNIIGFSWLGVEKIVTLKFEWADYFLWFPTFIHTFLFSLLSWWAMGFNYPKASISFWTTINLIAEIGQAIDKSFFDSFPTILKHYFQYGTFDWWDIFSIVLGAVFAYVFILKFKKGLV